MKTRETREQKERREVKEAMEARGLRQGKGSKHIRRRKRRITLWDRITAGVMAFGISAVVFFGCSVEHVSAPETIVPETILGTETIPDVKTLESNKDREKKSQLGTDFCTILGVVKSPNTIVTEDGNIWGYDTNFESGSKVCLWMTRTANIENSVIVSVYRVPEKENEYFRLDDGTKFAEKIYSIADSTGKGGYDCNGYYIAYNTEQKPGTEVESLVIYGSSCNRENIKEDEDAIAVFDNRIVRYSNGTTDKNGGSKY